MATCRLLPLTQLRENARSILGNVELMATRFVITDTREVVGELRQLSDSAEGFVHNDGANSALQGTPQAVAKVDASTEAAAFQLLPLTQLKRARRSLLGKIEHAGIRFIITDYGQAVAELGPVSKSARQALARLDEERKRPYRRPRAKRANVEERVTARARRGYAS